MGNRLKLYRNGAVGFIDWLDRRAISQAHVTIIFVLLNTLNGRFSTRVDSNRNRPIAFVSSVVLGGPFVMCH